jgi:hypothetical protein
VFDFAFGSQGFKPEAISGAETFTSDERRKWSRSDVSEILFLTNLTQNRKMKTAKNPQNPQRTCETLSNSGTVSSLKSTIHRFLRLAASGIAS